MTNVNDMMKTLSIKQSAFKSTETSARTRPFKQRNKKPNDHIVETIISILNNNKKDSKYKIKKVRFKRDDSNLFKIICERKQKQK
tara:strand:- start:1144 stop:1398 length:255 start_codon:yes stop_codon:yes gene_type:complete